jgi:hypothetical protein
MLGCYWYFEQHSPDMAGKSAQTAEIIVGRSNGSSPQIRYLEARVEPGMFRGEFLAHLTGFRVEQPDEPVSVQMLVDQNEVVDLARTPRRNRPEPALIRVTLAGQEHGLSRVILPQPAQPVGESMLVKTTALKEKLQGKR